MQRATRRRAIKIHHCDTCRTRIDKGEDYIEHVCSPNHDGLGNTKWWRIYECENCASLAGRTLILNPAVIQATWA